ncbi:telomere length regulation protein elg1 [Aspergillus udagawae]|nr:telomere length regulation protein elg1 [Aspergillus udagawae]
MALEHDPNSARRKRRKTEYVNEGTRAASTEDEPHQGDNTLLLDQTLTTLNTLSDKTNFKTNAGANNVTLPPAVPDVASSEVLSEPNSASDLPNPDRGIPDATSQSLQSRSPPQKTMKLTANGKLLSSPVAKQLDGTPQKKRRSKRAKAGKQGLEQAVKKLVILRYAGEPDKTKNIGQLINKIISGQTKYIPSRATVPPVPVAQKLQPPKPTHPFFLKPVLRKPDPCAETLPPSSLSQGVPGATSIPETRPDVTRSASQPKLFSSFRPRPKSPESIHPVWPPKGLGHIRGISGDSDRQDEDLSYPLNIDQKKAKMAAVQILDEESILRTWTNLNKDGPAALRLPQRHTASGRDLQQAIVPELSGSALADGTNSIVSHPAISRVFSSIPQSLTAFDRGEYDMSLWTQKYAPESAAQVLQMSKEAMMLRDWLKYLMISAVDTGKPSKDLEKDNEKGDDKKRKKKRKKADQLDGFIVNSSDDDFGMSEVTHSDDDELAGGVTVSSKKTVIRSGDSDGVWRSGAGKHRTSNVILLSGPPGCGKTASVYAVAKELDFEVFEINPGNRRSAKDIVERVGDMTQNHLVHKVTTGEDTSNNLSLGVGLDAPATDESRQNKLMGFFKPAVGKKPKNDKEAGQKDPQQEGISKRARSQKQSLILLEEADILFEEDKQFWSGVMALVSQSKRPIIITCNDENLIPLEEISFHAILRYKPPPQRPAVDYLLVLAANEGHMLKREAVDDLYLATGRDLRRTIMDLNFWCQMAIGSEKSGLDWIVDRWPKSADIDQDSDPLRVVSLNTYEPSMGWFSRDMLLDNTLDSRIESTHELLCWWQVSLQEAEEMADSSSDIVASARTTNFDATNLERLQRLELQSDYADLRSVLDVLCARCSLDQKLDSIDITIPAMSEKQRTNYIEGYPVLQADLAPDYSSLQASIGSTFEVFMGQTFRDEHQKDTEASHARNIMEKVVAPRRSDTSKATFLTAFEPLRRADHLFPPPPGRLAASVENRLGPLSEDLAPYIRAIMAFDLRLEHYRLQLSGLLSEDADGKKRMRKTRASRAALEGGSKAETRKERWLPPGTNPALILATGNKEWQDLLVRTGYFTVASMRESSKECSDLASESSGDGGI